MTIRNSTVRWGSASQSLHWLIVALMCLQVALALIFKQLPRGPMLHALIGYHRSIGITIFSLAVIRLFWRWANPVPALPTTLKPYERVLARFTHAALYVVLFAMPLDGWIGSWAHGTPVRWFDVLTVPAPVGKNPSLSNVMWDIHYALAMSLGVIVTVHIAGALKHHFFLKDDVLRRMLPGSQPAPSYEMNGRDGGKQTTRV